MTKQYILICAIAAGLYSNCSWEQRRPQQVFSEPGRPVLANSPRQMAAQLIFR